MLFWPPGSGLSQSRRRFFSLSIFLFAILAFLANAHSRGRPQILRLQPPRRRIEAARDSATPDSSPATSLPPRNRRRVRDPGHGRPDQDAAQRHGSPPARPAPEACPFRHERHGVERKAIPASAAGYVCAEQSRSRQSPSPRTTTRQISGTGTAASSCRQPAHELPAGRRAAWPVRTWAVVYQRRPVQESEPATAAAAVPAAFKRRLLAAPGHASVCKRCASWHALLSGRCCSSLCCL